MIKQADARSTHLEIWHHSAPVVSSPLFVCGVQLRHCPARLAGFSQQAVQLPALLRMPIPAHRRPRHCDRWCLWISTTAHKRPPSQPWKLQTKSSEWKSAVPRTRLGPVQKGPLQHRLRPVIGQDQTPPVQLWAMNQQHCSREMKSHWQRMPITTMDGALPSFSETAFGR